MLWYYDDAGNFVRNGKMKAGSYSVSSFDTAPASPAATGTLGEIRITNTGVYYRSTVNWWKMIPFYTVTETITGLTSTFKNGALDGVNQINKYQWYIESGTSSGIIESTHNKISGIGIYSSVTGATVQTVAENQIYSMRIGDSVLEIRFNITNGTVSYRIASGTVTEITVTRLQYDLLWK